MLKQFQITDLPRGLGLNFFSLVRIIKALDFRLFEYWTFVYTKMRILIPELYFGRLKNCTFVD